MNKILVAYSFAYLGLTLSCGGSANEPVAPEPPTERPRDDYDPTRDIAMTAEVGALPEDQTIYAFKDSFGAIQDCFVEAAAANEFLGGHIAFSVEVDSQGKVSRVFARESTLGDRNTEKCMFGVLRQAPWPKPVGGPIGVAENSFEFEVTGDVRPAVEWDADQIESVLSENAEAISNCKHSVSGSFTATVYVKQSGRAMSVGMAAPNKNGEEASDCLVDLLLQSAYPSPGSWPAKVTFRL